MWSKPIRLSIHSREGYPMTATSFPTSKAKEPTWKIVSAWKDFSEFTNLYPGERGSLHNVWWTLINAWLPVYHFFTYVACKFEMSHVFASNKTYEYRGGCDHLSVSIARGGKRVFFFCCYFAICNSIDRIRRPLLQSSLLLLAQSFWRRVETDFVQWMLQQELSSRWVSEKYILVCFTYC